MAMQLDALMRRPKAFWGEFGGWKLYLFFLIEAKRQLCLIYFGILIAPHTSL